MARRLTESCHEAMWRGIREVKPGARLGDIGHAIQVYAESNNFSVVREYCGHGIGRVYHEDPQSCITASRVRGSNSPPG